MTDAAMTPSSGQNEEAELRQESRSRDRSPGRSAPGAVPGTPCRCTATGDRVERDRRIRCLVETVLVSLGERDDAVARTEREVGQALIAITGDEGVSLREAVEWCGGALSLREASRLRSLARAGERWQQT